MNYIAAIILAAGQGTRMKSRLPKVLQPLAGVPLIKHVMSQLLSLRIPESQQIVVIAPNMEEVKTCVAPIATTIQTPALGTGHAVMAANPFIETQKKQVEWFLILYGDTPLIEAHTLQKMVETQADIVVLGFRAAGAHQYGRLILNETNHLQEIIEDKDASEEIKKINLCNSGVMAVKAEYLQDLLERLDQNNAKQEYYLTDIIKHGRKLSLNMKVIECDEAEVFGVNSKIELAQAETFLQKRLRHKFMEQGVTLIEPSTIYLSLDTKIGTDCIIEPHVFISHGVSIGNGVKIRAFSHLEDSMIGDNTEIGPFARVRMKSNIGDGVRIGNFVEVKKSHIGHGSKANHLAYLGDSHVGEKANIGAGTITCNYDGFQKSETFIDDGAFIGSNASLVAPVHIGKGAIVAAGSVITKNVEDGALGAARGEQRNIPEWAHKYKARKQQK